MSIAPDSTISTELNNTIQNLESGQRAWVRRTPGERANIAKLCIDAIGAVSKEWVNLSCDAKRIPRESGTSTEEITSGPIAVVRYLQLVANSLGEIDQFGEPHLPQSFRYRKTDDRFLIPAFPTACLFDRVVFPLLKAQIVTRADKAEKPLFDLSELTATKDGISLVLGAGNVSSVAATDALTRIFQEGRAVLLKMNPTLQYLTPVFRKAFQPLIAADVLAVIDGDAATGQTLLNDSRISNIQITGSVNSHDAIVWGSDPQAAKHNNQPVIDKPVTSELGNVTPWIIVPGKYSRRQLQFQARNIAASITNNAAFNCLATRVIVTCDSWSQRTEFLNLVKNALAECPQRYAYYPGALDRFERYSGQPAPSDGMCPWVLHENTQPDQSPELFQEESFVCVATESPLAAESEEQFLKAAADFSNNQLYGTLCANVTVPGGFQKRHPAPWQSLLNELKYGAIAVNQWVGLTYALMSLPWGGYPGATLDNAQSGIGWVHNTYMLGNIEKSILTGPLTMLPKPIWFANHGRPVPIARALQRLYLEPGIMNLVRLTPHVLRG